MTSKDTTVAASSRGRFLTAVSIIVMLQGVTSCVREQLQENYGFDAALREVIVDFGQCVDNNSNEVMTQLDALRCCTEVHTMQDLELDNVTQTELLGSNFCAPKCAPIQYAIRDYANRTEPFRLEVVSACALLTSHCGSCKRISQSITLFPGSPYSKSIDRGACDGRCDETGEGCVPVTHKFLSFEDPNGAALVRMVEKCGCMDRKCYREDYFVSYWEEVATANGTGGAPSVASVREKVINVGRCRGSCGGVMLPNRCYPSPSMCFIRIRGGQAVCAPATSTVHSFTGMGGVPLSVASIVSCSCMAA